MAMAAMKVHAFAAVLPGSAFAVSQPASSSTRPLWNRNSLATISSRTMDWPEWTEPALSVISLSGDVGDNFKPAKAPF